MPRQAWAQERAPDEGATEEEMPAERHGHHCLGEPGQKLVLHQLFGGQYNPWGVENTLRFGLCTPLIERSHVLFDYTHTEVGLIDVLSPVYNHFGTYFQVSPLSILQFRVESTLVGYWPFFFDRAGYFGLQGYDSDYRHDAFPAEEAGTALGWNVNFVTTFQARVGLGPVALVAASILNIEYWNLGTEPFYVNLKRDVILARSDWLLANEAILCLEIPLMGSRFTMSVGAFDTTRYVFRSGYLTNIAGGMLMFNVPMNNGRVKNITPFVRLGAYSHHEFRRGELGAQLAVMISYELWSR